MKPVNFLFALCMAVFFICCEENQRPGKKGAQNILIEKPDPNALASSYCECLMSSSNSDSCGQLSLNYAMKLATDKAALDLYHLKTDECLNAKAEADMSNAMNRLDEIEKKAISE